MTIYVCVGVTTLARSRIVHLFSSFSKRDKKMNFIDRIWKEMYNSVEERRILNPYLSGSNALSRLLIRKIFDVVRSFFKKGKKDFAKGFTDDALATFAVMVDIFMMEIGKKWDEGED